MEGNPVNAGSLEVEGVSVFNIQIVAPAEDRYQFAKTH